MHILEPLRDKLRDCVRQSEQHPLRFALHQFGSDIDYSRLAAQIRAIPADGTPIAIDLTPFGRLGLSDTIDSHLGAVATEYPLVLLVREGFWETLTSAALMSSVAVAEYADALNAGESTEPETDITSKIDVLNVPRFQRTLPNITPKTKEKDVSSFLERPTLSQFLAPFIREQLSAFSDVGMLVPSKVDVQHRVRTADGKEFIRLASGMLSSHYLATKLVLSNQIGRAHV